MFSTHNLPSDPPTSTACRSSPQLKPTDAHDNLDHLPKFSLRNYVFAARSKDIQTNWPFSSKTLQLCSRHGLKDILPPFEPLDKLKNLSCEAVKTSLSEKSDINNFYRKPHAANLAVVKSYDDKLGNELAEVCFDASACRSGGENGFPSTTTCVSQSEFDSFPPNRPANSELEGDTLSKASIRVETAAPRALLKPERIIRPPKTHGKNCRLIVNIGDKSDHILAEDIGSNTATLSETMTSKVCPVCKTFSSSSNTTLNAHIDRCLSVDSDPKWKVGSTVNRHRIKPRRTKLMVDIYTTAPKCTLEDLDRRNGTSWATFSHLSSQCGDNSNEGKIQRVHPIQSEDTLEDVGAVYVDANGVKVRILSKFSDLPSAATIGEDIRPIKPSKYGKGNKFWSTKDKTCSKKHQKYVKLGSESRTLRSHKICSSQEFSCFIWTCEGHHRAEDSCEKECSNNFDQEQITPRNFLSRGKWVCSKRTSLKNVQNKDGHQPLGCKMHLPRDLLFDSHHSLLGNSVRDRSHTWNSSMDPYNPCPENSGRKQRPLIESQDSDKGVPSTGKMKRILNDSGKDFSSVCDSFAMKPSSATVCRASSWRNNDVVHASLVKNSIANLKQSRSASYKLSNFSKPRKNLVIASNSANAEYRSNGFNRCSGLKKSQEHLMEEVDEEMMSPHSDIDLMNNNSESRPGNEKITEKLSCGRSRVQEVRLASGSKDISLGKSDIAFKGLRSDSSYNEYKSIQYTRVADKFPQQNNEPALTNEDALIIRSNFLTEQLDPEFQEFGNRPNASSSSMQSFEGQKGPSCGAEAARDSTESTFIDRPEELGNVIDGKSAHMGMELDSEVGKGEVLSEDPISVPGPPGSFLLSIRDMGSEEFQANSSLATSRLQSSHDQNDGYSSATSTFSNTGAARLDMQFLESFISERHHRVEEGSKSGFSGTSIQPSTDDSALTPQTTDVGAERITSHGKNLEGNRLPVEMGPLSFRSDHHPCCCQRTDRISYGVLNFCDAQLLKQRTISSLTMPCTVKEMGGNVKAMPDYLEAMPSRFPQGIFHSSDSEKVIPQVLISHAGPISLKRSDAVTNTSYGDSDSASPSSSNPVLRLMGKNLLVVNKDDDASLTIRNGDLSAPTRDLTSQFATISGVYPSSVQNKDCPTFHHMVSQDSTSVGRDSYNTGNPCFGANLNNFRKSKLKTSAMPPHVTETMYPNPSNFTVSMEPHQHSLLGRQNIPTNILHGAPQYYPEKATAIHGGKHKITDYVSNSRKEIIIIDDIPEREADSIPGIAKPNFDFNIRNVKPFPYYWCPDPRVLGKPPMMQNGNFTAIPSRQSIAHPVRRSCT